MSTSYRCTLVLLLLSLVAACTDADDPVSSPLNEVVAEFDRRELGLDGQQADVISDPFTPRLRINIVAESDLSPKAEIALRIEGVAVGPITSGRVSVMLPTQDQLSRNDRAPASSKLPVIASWRLPAMAAGDAWKQRVSVGSVDAGVYKVTVNSDTEGPRTAYGPYMVDDLDHESWMYVKDGRGGGELGLAFNALSFDERYAPQPGPFRARGYKPPTGGGSTGADSDDDDAVTVNVTYYDNTEYHAAEDANINGTMIAYENDDDDEDDMEVYNRTVPDDGYVTFPCPSSNQYLAGSVEVPETDEVKGKSLRSYWEATSLDCGDTIQVSATTKNYLPWSNLNEAIELIDADFGYERSLVDFTVIHSLTEGSSFDRYQDQIIFRATYRSQWTAAHEYVHALQHESLGGLIPHPPNCANHTIDSISSYECALQEGLADYGGNIGAPENRRYGDWEDYDDGEEGTKAKIEGYIAALFWDLTDDTSEEGDETEYDGSYVMAVYESCQVTTLRIFHARDDASDIVWCLENAPDSTVHNANFPGITAPVRVSEDADEPDDWDAEDIRSTWLLNLGGG